MRALFALILMLVPCLPVAAQTEVDVELALMVDVSRSMSQAELDIQRRGYAEALTSEAVFAAIQSGAYQRIALSYVEWAGDDLHRVIVDWQMLATRDDLRRFASALTATPGSNMRRTSISGALVFGMESLASNAYLGWRQVIDISGDGPNNQGPVVTQARDAAVARGIVINGLPLMTNDVYSSYFQIDDLDAYYHACVIGGMGAFVLPVYDWADFATAVRRKLVLELAAAPHLAPIPVQFTREPAYDCLIGEKLRERRMRDFDDN